MLSIDLVAPIEKKRKGIETSITTNMERFWVVMIANLSECIEIGIHLVELSLFICC